MPTGGRKSEPGRVRAAIPVRVGTISLAEGRLVRSDVRWLKEDGQACRAGDLIGYCNIAMAAGDAGAFAEESFDLQVAFAAPVAGIFRRQADASRGGYIARLAASPWRDDQLVGHIEPAADAPRDADPQPRRLFLAGRRPQAIIEDRSGLLTGWHDRRRAWWGEGVDTTLIGAGTCEQDAILRGEDMPFHALFMASEAGHVVLTQGEPLVPSARILIERMARTADDVAAIRADAIAGLAAGAAAPTAADWLFMGALLNGLEHSPLNESHDLLDGGGLRRVGPAGALCLSLGAELPVLFRHKRLGYAINCHGYRLVACGVAVRQWIRTHFEMVERTVDAVRADYATLAHHARLFAVNLISTQGHEMVRNYAMLDAQTFAQLGTVRSKRLNLMLHDLAADDRVDIVDGDAISARLGMSVHLPDGTHASGAINAAIRAELLAAMRARGVFSR